MKLLITIACLIAATGSCFAQSDLVFYDTDGDLDGSLVQFVEDSSCDNGLTQNPLVSCDAILQQDIFLTTVKLTTGEITNTGFRYQSDDCTGQPYLLAAHVGPRGGMLLSRSDPTNPVLVEVEWYPNYTNITLESYQNYNGICGYSAKNELAMIANIVDPAKYGMKVIPVDGSKAIGFQEPLTPVNERPDGMFCNSFENCPTQ